ncbi:excinuclease ABC subunit UvrC [Solwaraspora sp. WMMD937]|uniref:excinuclease ABC subunit UvrC n=1 Tax=Solwaraspora sp. WMMD937 TaxID=3016090 RepID=UPI00249BEAF5|nr:excinuclease ABC subunit UvrC [Solwaraspora sp. WMMD937]WFE20833.1 excinuclease ABC subunit UvrC [Solwaraspora sp. WMMD937]
MPDPSSYRPAPGTIPDSPGVYRFRDPTGRVIYVGKAKSLRSRLNSYFGDLWQLHQRTQQMVTTAASVDWVTVGSEVEALQLEYLWIKEYDPRFNVRYRDDKSYPYLAVTLDEEFPRLQVMRGAKRKGVRYFGPYSHAWAIRETLDLLLRVFPARTCSAGVFRQAGQVGRPCLLGDIGKCSAPCVGRVDPAGHRAIVDEFCDFMAGRTDTMVRRLERDMHDAAEALEFERAARLRDDVAALRKAMEKQTVVLGDGTDADVVAFAEDPLEAAVQVFHVRGGRVRGQRGWVVEKVEQLTTADLVHHFCTQVYGPEQGETDVPRELLVPELPADAPALADWLTARRGSRVTLRVPQRGDKRALMETVARNAGEALTRHKLRRASDLTTRSQALEEIAEALGLATAPLRIECFDVSQIQGTDVVASLVVFEDGLPRKAEYRRFAVRGATDDLSAMSEVLRRRFARHRQPSDEPPPQASVPADDVPAPPAVGQPPPGVDPQTGRPRRFAYPPQLVVVDGGAPQVQAAATVLAELGVDDVALCGLAKRLEEVWLPGDDYPVILPRTSEGLYLLQRIRDEAHRFAITYHRQRRSKRMTASGLDQVPGLGETRRKALLRHFGSVRRIASATVDEITEVPGIGRRTAETIVAALAGSPDGGADRT